MNIVRKIHDQFRVKTVAGAKLETPKTVSSQEAGGSTFITITGGGGGTSLSGSGLSEQDRIKLDSIEQGAQVNQDAFSKLQFDISSIDENDQISNSNSTIIANVPTDTANIKIVGNYPITVNLESVSLFNSNTSTTTGTTITTYNISFNSDNNIVIEYVDGALLKVTDVELIQVKHKENILATYQLSDITYTTSDSAIVSFTIPYSNTDFSEIEFCKYETVTTETETGSTTVRELRVLSTLPASPTKQSIITLNNVTGNFWNYEEDENGNKFVWTDYNVYSTKDVSAYGRGTDLGNVYASNLYELKDVVLTDLSNNDLLIYNSNTSKWVNINKDKLGISADQLYTLTININGVTQAIYNPTSADASVNISTITLDEVTKYIDQEIDTKLGSISSLTSKLDKDDFFTWFTIIKNTSGEVVSIQANFDFYSIGEVSAYGLGDMGGSGRTTLSTLDDVSLSNLITNDMLTYNGSKWVNIPMSQVRGVTSWTDLENKPTTLSGFGITDVYTKSQVDSKISEVSSKVTELSSTKADATIQVIAGDGLTGGGNLQQDITISLQNLNSTGIYYKVNVDAYGRVTSGISQLTIADIQNLQTQLDSKLNIADFNTWFTIIYNTDGTIKNIRANYDFYSVGEVLAYGIGDEEKKTYTTLAELNDVQLTNVKETDVLVYNGTKWVNVDQSTIKGAQSWVDIQNKPTTISGFGIVDAYTKTEIDNKLSPINSSITTINSSINTINTNISDLSSSLSGVSTKLNNFLEGSDTDTIINKWKELEAFLAGYTQTQTLADLLSVKANSSIQIIAGTGLVGGGDLTANRTISLGTSGVSAGTYTKVTVDTYGRVTSGSTLSAPDIPNLDWSKITSGKPTTLEGYGITDGVNSITIIGSGNAITTVTISNHLLTFTKGETFLPKSTFDDLFEKVNVGTTDSPVYAIKAKYHLYSVGEVSAYEFGETSGTGVSSLEELIDVQLTNLVADSILKYNGSKWINVPITEVKGATSWNEIEDKPTTFAPSTHTHTVADITDISTKYISISTTQTVSGLKTFTSTVKYQPTYYSYNAEDIEYRTITGTLFGGIGAVHNGSSISYFYIGKGSTPWDGNDGLTIGDELGFKGHTVWHSGNTTIPTIPNDILKGNYVTLDTTQSITGTKTFTNILSAPQFSAQYDGVYTNYRLYLPELESDADSTTIPRIGRFNREEGSAVLQLGTSNIFDIVDASWSTTLLRVSSSEFTYKDIAISLNGHTHNYLPLSGGTMSAGARISSITDLYFGNNSNNGCLYFMDMCSQLGSNYWQILQSGDAYFKGNVSAATFCGSLSGNANTATALTTSAGSSSLPVYFSNGKPVTCSTQLGVSITGSAAIANALATSAGATNTPIYFKNGKPTGVTLIDTANNLLNNLTTEISSPLDADYYIAQCVGGGTTTTTYHRKPHSLLYAYIKGKAEGTWAISVSGNAASATKLQTARTIWGQSFDGTANVSGDITGVGIIYQTGNHFYGAGGEGICINYKGIGWHDSNNTQTGNLITCTSDLNIGIGTTTPIQKLHVVGNIIATGEMTAYSSSDIRLKTNLNELNSLSIIRKLGVYSFDWNEEALQLRVNKNIHDYGLIAQQVQQYIPEVINTNMFNKGYLGIDYQKLVPFTISAIKEVDDEVTKLKKRVKQLERRLQKYESTEVFYTKGDD